MDGFAGCVMICEFNLPSVHMRIFSLTLAIVASSIALSLPTLALEKRFMPRSTITQPQTDAQRLNTFKPPPPLPAKPSVFQRGEGAITHTFKNGATIRPDANPFSKPPTIGVKGTFK